MAQYDFGTIDPNTKSGTALATDLNSYRNAVNSMHSGSSAPSYITAGMMWVDTTSANYEVKLYDGAQSITVAIIDATNNVARVAVDPAETSYITSTTNAQIRHVIASTDIFTTRSTGIQFNLASPVISDRNNNELISFTTTASAVNQINVANAATGGAVEISAVGSDTNISMALMPKGTGSVNAGGPITSTGSVSNSIGQLYSLRNIVTLTTGTAATYTPTSGTKAIRVTAIGAGGGGGGVDGQGAGTAGCAGGGGAGARAEILITSLSASYTYTVSSTGGAGGTAGANNGATGATTTFAGGAVSLSAAGGAGGTGRTAGAGGLAGQGGAGGTATGGTFNIAGASGFTGLVQGGLSSSEGKGGSGIYGAGGAGTTVSGSSGGGAGDAGTGFGSGGGGAGVTGQSTNYAGGAGGAGLIIVEELA